MADEDCRAVEPLMRGTEDQDETTPQKPVKSQASTFVYALTFAAGVSGLLFGYE